MTEQERLNAKNQENWIEGDAVKAYENSKMKGHYLPATAGNEIMPFKGMT